VLRVIREGVIEAGDPTFSPDGKRLAFYGLDRDGKIDIYTVSLTEPDPQSGGSPTICTASATCWGDDRHRVRGRRHRERPLQPVPHQSG